MGVEGWITQRKELENCRKLCLILLSAEIEHRFNTFVIVETYVNTEKAN